MKDVAKALVALIVICTFVGLLLAYTKPIKGTNNCPTAAFVHGGTTCK